MDKDKLMAKMQVLEELRDMMSQLMGEDLKSGDSMKEVTVAAPDEESLKAGLEEAEEVVEEMPMDDTDSEEHSDEEEDEDEDLLKKLMR